MKNISNHKKDVLEEIVETYKRKFKEQALYNAVKDQKEKYSHFGKDDYIDITYYENEEIRHLLLVGDILQYGDYIVAKINQKSKISLIKKVFGNYEPLTFYEVGEYL